MKIITYYLPQFHTIPENDAWWGKGFTEWVNVKKAEPLYDGHDQPRVPLNDNYYNLLDKETISWQAKIAKEHGVYGFCFYHYWFGSKLLLHKPMEILLESPEIDINYCISWANENWTNQWVSNSPQILVSQEYGDEEEWSRHYNYLQQFFKDPRYIKFDNKPVLVIYKPTNIDCIDRMIDFLNDLAIKDGFDGICFMSQISNEAYSKPEYFKKIDYYLDYQPSDYMYLQTNTQNSLVKSMKNVIKKTFRKYGIELEGKKTGGVRYFNYSDIWDYIIAKKPKTDKEVPGCFVDWDNSPRKGKKATIVKGASPKLFEKYLRLQIDNCEHNYNKDFMFVFAWNEWAEGGYLEPDKMNGYGNLEAIKRCVGK